MMKDVKGDDPNAEHPKTADEKIELFEEAIGQRVDQAALALDMTKKMMEAKGIEWDEGPMAPELMERMRKDNPEKALAMDMGAGLEEAGINIEM